MLNIIVSWGPIDVTQIASNFVSNKAEVIIRMRGLPFNTKESDVVSLLLFFLPSCSDMLFGSIEEWLDLMET